VSVAEVNHFSYGWITPVMAYAMSFLGSLLGLVCTARAREARPYGRHKGWLILAAVAIGAAGIWLMHFLAMLGFDVPASTVAYNVPLTLLSAVIAVAVVGAGLFLVSLGRTSLPRLLAGGTFTGLGVAVMHYTGMAAMQVGGSVTYDRRLVLASLVIAVVAATVALWFTLVVRGGSGITIAAAVMGVAVCGMHYTGMAAVHVRLPAVVHTPHGLDPLAFLVPIISSFSVVVAVMLYAILTAPTEKEREINARRREAAPDPV
jgi:NO-binding membrane sensor protein with MHYT domain